jgi:hypothetical protein
MTRLWDELWHWKSLETFQKGDMYFNQYECGDYHGDVGSMLFIVYFTVLLPCLFRVFSLFCHLDLLTCW